MNIQIVPERIRFVELRRRLLELRPDLVEETLSDTLEGATRGDVFLSWRHSCAMKGRDSERPADARRRPPERTVR
jgi:hypothetical protein